MKKPNSKLVENLKVECAKSRTEIAARFVKRATRPEGSDYYAWGQYLEVVSQAADSDLGDQYGIYGTSAGLQVLASHSASQHDKQLRGGLAILPWIGPDTDDEVLQGIRARFEAKGDLKTLYKLCALEDAAVVVGEHREAGEYQPDTTRVLEALFDLREKKAGWPDYAGGSEYHGPNAHATAVALFSISRMQLDATHESACCEALHWLSGQRSDTMSVATLAMTAMAIRRFHQNCSKESVLRSKLTDGLLETCEQALFAWVRSTSPREVLRSLEGTEYWLPLESVMPHPTRFTFLFYLPHCLAALAVMASPDLFAKRHGRRFVLGVVRIVATRMKDEHGYFIAAGRNVAATVEHLWLYRLLNAFEESVPYAGWRSIVLDRISEHSWGKVLSAIATSAMVALVVSTALTHGQLQIALGALSALVVALASALLVTIALDST